MKTVNQYLQETFGEKLYKISLNAGMTCPNRDGRIGYGGCSFCSEGGSGDFAADHALSMEEQIETAKLRVKDKYPGEKFIAYFQAFTNTYAPAPYLKALFTKVALRDDIAALSIATRPDCLGEDVLAVLQEVAAIKPLWVELGLQSVHPRTHMAMKTGFRLKDYDEAVRKLSAMDIHVISHVILGLPGESRKDTLDTVQHVADLQRETGKILGIKLQLLHVLKGTALYGEYLKGSFETLSFEGYLSLVCDCVSLLNDDIIIHRLTGDGPKKLLAAPLWSADKKKVLNALHKELRSRGLE